MADKGEKQSLRGGRRTAKREEEVPACDRRRLGVAAKQPGGAFLEADRGRCSEVDLGGEGFTFESNTAARSALELARKDGRSGHGRTEGSEMMRHEGEVGWEVALILLKESIRREDRASQGGSFGRATAPITRSDEMDAGGTFTTTTRGESWEVVEQEVECEGAGGGDAGSDIRRRTRAGGRGSGRTGRRSEEGGARVAGKGVGGGGGRGRVSG
jgi:hypothetical protein